ncbi:MAG: hypothetical protein J2P36_32415 [Ktedonobacteraceae bacterium]|nr:hypothetical protein [Ktedonobacteraceae bacterium]
MLSQGINGELQKLVQKPDATRRSRFPGRFKASQMLHQPITTRRSRSTGGLIGISHF